VIANLPQTATKGNLFHKYGFYLKYELGKKNPYIWRAIHHGA
jgi:hypothetical protein